MQLKLPSRFRATQLPARRHACLTLIGPQQLDEAMHFIIQRSQSGLSHCLSGEPAQLLLPGDNKTGLELRLPLLDCPP